MLRVHEWFLPDVKVLSLFCCQRLEFKMFGANRTSYLISASQEHKPALILSSWWLRSNGCGKSQCSVNMTIFVIALCSLKLECEKLASEKTEMQRHYVMVRKPYSQLKMSLSISLYSFYIADLCCWRQQLDYRLKYWMCRCHMIKLLGAWRLSNGFSIFYSLL